MVYPMHRAAAVLLAVLATPLTAQTITTLDHSGKDVRRKCDPAITPRQLPAVDEIVDATALALALSAWSATGTVSVMIDDRGLVHGVRALATDSAGLALAEAIHAAVRSVDRAEVPWAIRLHASRSPAGDLVLSVSRALYCPPAMPEGGSPVSRTARVVVRSSGAAPLPAPSPGPIIAAIKITERGLVQSVRIERGSGIREMDDEVERNYRQARFLPAMFDWMPVASVFRTGGPQERR